MNQAWTRLAVLPLTVAGFSVLLNAQGTSTTPATCTTAPASLTNLSIERALPISNILSTQTPNTPPAILAGLAAGASEIRTRLIYNPQLNTLTDTTFVVPTGSPLPTPLAIDVTQQTIQGYIMSISQILFSCQPAPSLLITGTLSAAGGPFGNLNGAPAAVSIGYTTDNPPKINNVVELVAGQIVAYSAGAQGTLTFPVVPVTPPTTPTGAPTIVVTPTIPPGGALQVNINPLGLSGANSTDPNNLALTYAWTSDKPINFIPNNASATTAYFQSGPGDYKVTLTVTNSAGLVSMYTFTLQYISK